MYLNNSDILNFLKEYESNPHKKYAILINGNWGSGKTYFIKNEYIQPKDKNKLYISLYGIGSKQELEKKISYKIIEKIIKSDKKTINNIIKKSKKLFGLVKSFIPKSCRVFNIDIPLSEIVNIDIYDAISLFTNIKNHILIFDDLERCNIPIDEILGYINEYVEHENIKVIIIANEKEISRTNRDNNNELKIISCTNSNLDFQNENSNKSSSSNSNDKISIENLKSRIELLYESSEKYKIIKEKLIGFTIQYQPNISDIYDHIIKKYEIEEDKKFYSFLNKYKDELINATKRVKCQNIRTIIYILDIFRSLFDKCVDIVNSENIMRLIYKNTIYSGIEFKKEIDIKPILNGCKCNPTAKIGDYKNGDYYVEFSAFDFVNDFIITGKLNESKIIPSIEYYKKLSIDQLDLNDPFYKLKEYWFLDDASIEKVLNEIKENVKNGVYNYRLFPTIINYLSYIEKLEFQVDLIHGIVDEMINNLQSQYNIQPIDCLEHFEDKEVLKIYNGHIQKMKNKISAVNIIQNKRTIEKILDLENWGIELYKYIQENYQQYLNQKGFIKELNIEAIINAIKLSDIKNVYHFKYSLDKIYHFSNLSECYPDDGNKIEDLIKKLKNLNTNSFGVMKREAVKLLINRLNEISDKLKN